MKIGFIVGTRPDIIKTIPIIRECEKRKIDFFLVRSFQHTSDDMFIDFCKELNVPEIKYTYTKEFDLYNTVSYIRHVLLKENADYFIVGGDTDTALVGGLAGMDVPTKLVHRESGIRSFDRRMHEEKNRIFLSKICDIKFVPTGLNRENLYNEWTRDNVYVTGNTIADSLKIFNFDKFKAKAKRTALLTFHRKENIENINVCKNLIRNLGSMDYTFLYPIHPNTKNVFKSYKLDFPDNFIVCLPYGYKETLAHIKQCEVVYTDSGGIQEESSIIGTPCVVLRRTTDRPELLKLGASYLINPEEREWEKPIFNNEWVHPYGENVSKKMINILESDYG